MLGTSQLTLSYSTQYSTVQYSTVPTWHPGWVRLPSYVTNCAVAGTSEDRDTAVRAVEVPGQQTCQRWLTMLGFGNLFRNFL